MSGQKEKTQAIRLQALMSLAFAARMVYARATGRHTDDMRTLNEVARLIAGQTRVFVLNTDKTAMSVPAETLSAGEFENGGENVRFGGSMVNQLARRHLVFGPPPKMGGPEKGDQERRGPANNQQKSKLRVLVVEDNLDSLHSLVALLRFEGHNVEFAINGYAAMSMAEKFQPDVVLLDLGLPGVDGYEVCRWLKLQPGMETSRIIAVTGYGAEADRVKSRAAGCSHHLTKPYDLQQLLSLVSGEQEG